MSGMGWEGRVENREGERWGGEGGGVFGKGGGGGGREGMLISFPTQLSGSGRVLVCLAGRQ